MNRIVKAIITRDKESKTDIKKDYERIRKIRDIISTPILKSRYGYFDYGVVIKKDNIPIRIFYPSNEDVHSAIIFFHGGGWVTGNIDTYTKMCRNIADNTNNIVLSVDYRLAPEYKFPLGFNDCYEVTKHFISNAKIFNIKSNQITIMGDSAGGNLAAAVALKARDKKEFKINKQILLYPVTNAEHKISSFPSVKENKNNLGLCLKEVNDYISLYKKTDKDLINPYFAPLLAKKFNDLPKTLVVSAELDLLRDEGEAFANKIIKSGGEAEIFRVKDVGHGFFHIFNNTKSAKKVYKKINEFLER